ncbi:MAG: YiiX/YebB-like N1pC/P60 family cysteine hydrolase [Pirellulaceae bacterium]
MLPLEITHSIRTVLHVAEHFVRIKQSAGVLLRELGASSRGFFTPTEDEQVRQLLVSYWHMRNALFELVLENRDYNSATTCEEKRVRFLIAFAGALVLIDAARFLRDNVHGRPIVRHKLNEAEPTFDIPVGVYDRIQKSLTSLVHAWHLYHALRFWEENQTTLRQMAASHKLVAELIELTERLRLRLDVRLEDLVAARLRARGRAFRTHVQRDLLFCAMYGLQKAVSRLLSEKYIQLGHRPALPLTVVDQLRSQLQPGDVLITRKEFALTNYFLPGFWPHAALYVGLESDMEHLQLAGEFMFLSWLPVFRECGPCDEGRVLEALKDGVRLRCVTTPLTCDAIALVRPRLSREHIRDALARGFHFVGRPYDFDFDFSRSDRMVCTEVVYRSYEGVGGLRFALVRRAGRLTLSAEDLMQMALQQQGFEIVGAYAPGFGAQWQWAGDAVRTLQETLRSRP